MLRRKPLNNKKIIIIVTTLLLVLFVGIVTFIATNKEEIDDKNTGTKIEQGKGDEDTIGDENKTDTEEESDGTGNNGHQVLKPNEVATENSTDASGDWEDEESDSQKDMTENDVPQDDMERDYLEDDIEEDDISWGEIY